MLRKFIFHHGLVTEGCLSMDPANEEIIQGVYKKNIREGEERLMLAVLESAVEDFQKYLLARHASGKKLFQQAEERFFEKDSDELFSFESICETLGLHPDPIRKGLMVWKEGSRRFLLRVLVKVAESYTAPISGTLQSDFPRRHNFPCRNCNPSLHWEP
jgi:hypothetical protein